MSESRILVRYATLKDVPSISRIYIQAMPEDEVFDYVNCYRHIYPDDHLFYHEQRLKKALYDPAMIVMVAQMRQNTRGKWPETSWPIISFAIWSVKGVQLPRQRRLREFFVEKVMCETSFSWFKYSPCFALTHRYVQPQSFRLSVGALLDFWGCDVIKIKQGWRHFSS